MRRKSFRALVLPFFAYECDETFAGDYCDTRRRKEQKVRNAANMLPNEQLRRERQRRGWSREYVAEQIGLADAKTIGRWERGAAFPSSYFLQKLCTLFGMLAQDLGLYPVEQHNPMHAPATRPESDMLKVSTLKTSFARELTRD